MKIIATTQRLVLREYEETDAEAVYELGSNPEVIRYTGESGFQSIEEASEMLRTRPLADYRKYGYGRWACVLKSNEKLIGFAGLKYLEELGEVDLGYRLLPTYWGAGLATEASLAAVDYGFQQLDLDWIIGLVVPANTRSIRVLEKCGLTFDRLIDHQHAQPVAQYSLTKTVYLEKRQRATSERLSGGLP